MRPPTALADGAESGAGMSRARFTAAELTKEVATRELEGLRARGTDAATLLGESSEEIEELEALGDVRRKEVRALEGRICKEETLHRKSRIDMEAGLCAKEEEICELEAGAEGLSEEALKLRTEPTEGERRNASRANEVRAL